MMGILAVCHIVTPDHTVTNFYGEVADVSRLATPPRRHAATPPHLTRPPRTNLRVAAETALLSHSTPTLHCVALLGAGYLAISYSLITASVKGAPGGPTHAAVASAPHAATDTTATTICTPQARMRARTRSEAWSSS